MSLHIVLFSPDLMADLIATIIKIKIFQVLLVFRVILVNFFTRAPLSTILPYVCFVMDLKSDVMFVFLYILYLLQSKTALARNLSKILLQFIKVICIQHEDFVFYIKSE